MSGNSSNSEDEYGKIKEAVDCTFLTEDLYADDKGRKNSISPGKCLPSLRHQDHLEVDNNPFSIKVTPEFQRHVSKHLSKLLDELIDDTEIIHKHKKLKVNKNVKSGIKLLSSSTDYLSSTNNTDAIEPGRKLHGKINFNEINYEERAKEVAVSPEWVLSQEETRHWAPYTKGEIEIVKLSDNYGKMIHKRKVKR